MSVFMEKSGVGEWSPHLYKAEGLQLRTARLSLGKSFFPTRPLIRAPTHKPLLNKE